MLLTMQRLRWLSVLMIVGFLVLGCSNPEKKKAAHYEKGMQYVEKEDWRAAIIEFQNAVKIDPKYAEVRYQLGLAYLEDGQIAKAVRELVITADLNPDNLDAQLKIGRMLLLAAKIDESRERALLVLDKNPENVEALHLLAIIQFTAKQYIEATEIIEKAIVEGQRARARRDALESACDRRFAASLDAPEVGLVDTVPQHTREQLAQAALQRVEADALVRP